MQPSQPSMPSGQTPPSRPLKPKQMTVHALRCRYPGKRCENPRAVKRNGEMHRLCEEHRLKANINQKRLDERKRSSRQPEMDDSQEHQKALREEDRDREDNDTFDDDSPGAALYMHDAAVESPDVDVDIDIDADPFDISHEFENMDFAAMEALMLVDQLEESKEHDLMFR